MNSQQLAAKAAGANLPYPDLHIVGDRWAGWTVFEHGKAITPAWRTSVRAQQAACAIRNARWLRQLAELAAETEPDLR